MDFDRIDTETEGKEERQTRRGCLWPVLKLSLFSILPLLILAGLLPSILSSAAGNRWIMGWVNERISPAQIGCSSLSVGWFSSLRLQNLRYEDPREGLSIHSEETISDAGLFGAFPVGRIRLGKVKIWNPVLRVGSPRFSTRPEGEGLFIPALDFSGSFVVENGSAVWTGTQGSSPVEIKGIHAEVDHPSIWKPFSLLVSATVGKGSLSISGTLKSIADFSSGEVSSKTARSLSLTAEQVDLASLRPFTELLFAHSLNCKGIMSGLASVQIDGPKALSGKSSLKIEHFSVVTSEKAHPPEGHVNLDADFRLDGEEIRFAPLSITTPWGYLRAEGSLRQGENQTGYVGTLQSTARIDLVPFTRDFGTVVGLPNELSVRSGNIQAKGSLSAGADACQLDLSAEGKQIVWTTGGVSCSLTPSPQIHLQMDLPYDPDGIPNVRQFQLRLPFADAKGGGYFNSFNLFGTLDLDALSKSAGKLFPQRPILSGRISFEAGSEQSGKRVMLGALVSGKGISITPESGNKIRLPDWRGAVKGHLPSRKSKSREKGWQFDDGAYELKIGKGAMVGSWSRMTWDERSILTLLRGMKVQAHFSPEALALLLGDRIAPETRQRLRAARGEWIANGSAEIASGEMRALWNMAVSNWKIVGAEGGEWSIPDLRFEGSLAQGGRSGISLRSDFTYSGSAICTRDGLTLFEEDGARGQCKTEWNGEKNSLKINRVSYSGSLGDLDFAGSIKDLGGVFQTDIEGVFAPDLKVITSLLYAYGIQNFSYQGRKLRKFSIHAPLGGGLESFLKKGKLSAAVYVESLKGMGIQAGASDFAVELKDGQLKSKYCPIVNGGKGNVCPKFSLQKNRSFVQLPAGTRVFDNIAITQELFEYFLINLNPMLRDSKIRKGTLTWDVQHFSVDLDAHHERSLDCSFVITLRNLELQAGHEFKNLMALLKIKDPIYRADKISFPIQIKEGKITLVRTEIPLGDGENLACYGWIAADGKLAYTLEVPVTGKVFGPMIANFFGGATFKIPVTGTIEHPYIDTAAFAKAMSNSFTRQPHPQFSLEKFYRELRKELKKSISR